MGFELVAMQICIVAVGDYFIVTSTNPYHGE